MIAPPLLPVLLLTILLPMTCTIAVDEDGDDDDNDDNGAACCSESLATRLGLSNTSNAMTFLKSNLRACKIFHTPLCGLFAGSLVSSASRFVSTTAKTSTE
jgi:hypothetical protein